MRMLRAAAARVPPSTPSKMPRAKVVILATTCSNPEVTKAARHHAMAIILATSLVDRVTHQIARHTRTLHMMPRTKSWIAV